MKNGTRLRRRNVEAAPANVRINLSLGLRVSRDECFAVGVLRR